MVSGSAEELVELLADLTAAQLARKMDEHLVNLLAAYLGVHLETKMDEHLEVVTDWELEKR